MKNTLTLALIAGLIISASSALAGQKITAASLLGEMVDRDAMASLPAVPYTLRQASSYDRRSVSPDAPGWFANDDWSWFLRTDRSRGHEEHVMMDAEGPGAIVRFWMTFSGRDCGRGILRIYIDDLSRPAIEGSALDVLSGGLICGAPLSESVSSLTPYENRGHDLYYPILYAKRCVVTYESENVVAELDAPGRYGSECVYYNIGYRTYPAGTEVQSFAKAELRRNASLIASVNQQLRRGADKAQATRGSRLQRFGTELPAGEQLSLRLTGSRAITALSLMLDADDREQALRSTVMQLVFDGDTTLFCPVGDFFGTGYRNLHTHTWLTDVTDRRMLSLWVMPFRSSCELIIRNLGSQTVRLTKGELYSKPWRWTDRSMHFGANWTIHSRYLTGDGQGRTQPRDVSFTRLRGEGCYVGDAISLYDTDGGWWGEGDEKIYVDSDSFPSHFGTGTEDYFGYAWCRPEVFTGHPFIAQPCGDADLSEGYTSNSRYRSLDRIPFQSRLDFDMEIYHWSQSLITYASTSFWYLRPGGRCLSEPMPEGAREPVVKQRTDLIPCRLELSIEGENMLVTGRTGGRASSQGMADVGWSKNGQMWWTEAAPGDELLLRFDSPVAGTFRMVARLGMARDYSAFALSFNGRLLAERLDMYAPEVSACDVDFGPVELREGANELRVRILAPASGFSICMMGIDKLTFEL